MTEEDKLDYISKINVQLARLLCTQNPEVVKSWWHRQNTKFDPTPLEYIQEDPEELLYMLEYFTNCKSH